jgi:hypothetical protein
LETRRQDLRIVEYIPEQFEILRRAANQIGPKSSLAHRAFVDYYYTGNEWCHLDLVLGDDGCVVGTFGTDRMTFQAFSREMTFGLGSNFHSRLPGSGGYLWMKWLKSFPYVFVFGGSEDTHRICRSQGWTYFSGVKIYLLNKPYEPLPGEAWWRKLAKSVLRRTARSKLAKFTGRISSQAFQGLTIREENAYTEDLLPRHSPFTFRFSPSVEYLAWRYNTTLSFVRYRLFRILQRGAGIGYVILNESPDRIIVAQCDGKDPAALARGVLLSILEVGHKDTKPRAVLLSSSHAIMQKIYEQFGFRAEPEERPFAIKSSRGSLDLGTDTSNWLINFDWGDNGLRVPFLNQLSYSVEP